MARGLARGRYPFGHGREHALTATQHLIDSYHCSRYNTATRRLTAEMFRAVVARACELAGLAAPRVAGLTRMFDHKEYIAALPRRPGVYRMYGADQELLYVGKARSLKDRVGTLLPRQQRRPQGAGAGGADRAPSRSRSPTPRPRRCCSSTTSSRRTSRASTSCSRTTRAFPTSSCATSTAFRGWPSTAGRARPARVTSAHSPTPARCATRSTSCRSCSASATAATASSPTAAARACSTRSAAARRRAWASSAARPTRRTWPPPSRCSKAAATR